MDEKKGQVQAGTRADDAQDFKRWYDQVRIVDLSKVSSASAAPKPTGQEPRRRF